MGIETKYQETDVLFIEDCEGLYEVVFEQKSQGSDEISHTKSWGMAYV